MSAVLAPARTLLTRIDGAIGAIPASIGLLALRIALALPFWRSGLTKWDGPFNLSLGAQYLFEEEFKLHILGNALAYPAPVIAAYLAGIGEIILPISLVLGLLTRLSALGILIMTIIIQLTVPDGWVNFHLPWMAMSLVLMRYGSGTLGVDALLGRTLQRSGPPSVHHAA